ncbi:MAG: hypothetical protein K8R11_12990 [Methanococcoides sp.]|nr:hypothetical protein [Methanococcoides sp.]
MTIKSMFLPKEGLQGEEIPSHITWDNLEYDQISLDFPDFLKIKEIYNVSALENDCSACSIDIVSPDVDGYVGLLFESLRSECEKKLTGFVTFSFIRNGTVFYRKKKEISLHRPLIEVLQVPLSINISFPEKEIDNKICISNIGDATSVLVLMTAEESEIAEDLSDDQKQSLDEISKSLEDEVLFLKETYPKHSILLDDFLNIARDPELPSKDFNNRFEETLLNDSIFSDSFGDSIQRIFITNIKFKSLINSFVAYTESLVGSKIFIFNPFTIIPLSEEPKTILLRLVQSDLLLSEYDPIEIQPITISANSKGAIELHKLFNWGDNGIER